MNRPACLANRCHQGRTPCPCPQACQLPDSADAPRAGLHTHTHRPAARTPQRHRADQHGRRWPLATTTPPQPEDFGLGVLGHLAVVLVCLAALAVIVITAPRP